MATGTLTVIDGTGSGNYQLGSYIGIFRYAPNPDSVWTGWASAVNGSVNDPNAPSAIFHILATGASIVSTYALKTFSLSYGAGVGGYVSGNTSQTVNYGADGSQVTANPDPGYYFVKWSDNNYSASRTETNVTANKSVSAQFASSATYYELTVNLGTGDGAYEENDVVEVEADAPAEGYAFLEWTGPGVAYLVDFEASPTNLTMPAEATAITATYSIESVIKTIAGEPVLDVKEINDIILMDNKKIGGLSNNP